MKKEMFFGCPVQHALGYIGGKWQIGILWKLKSGVARFYEIKDSLPDITEKVLAENLKFFEQAGIIQKTMFATVPPKVEYRLTADGETLVPVIEKILSWGYEHLKDEKINPRMLYTPLPSIGEIETMR